MQTFASSTSLKHPASPKRAQKIMGKNFHDLAQAMDCFKIRWSKDLSSNLATIPTTEDLLEVCRETHILVPGLPLSIFDMLQLVPRSIFAVNQSIWLKTESFVRKNQVPTQWLLLRKEPEHDIAGDYKNTVIAPASSITYGIILHQLLTGERLYSTPHVCTADTDSEGCRVTIQNKIDGIRFDGILSKPPYAHAATMRSMFPVVRYKHQEPKLLAIPRFAQAIFQSNPTAHCS